MRYPTSLLLTCLLSCIALCLVALLLIVQGVMLHDWYRISMAGFAYVVFQMGGLVAIAKLAGWHDA